MWWNLRPQIQPEWGGHSFKTAEFDIDGFNCSDCIERHTLYAIECLMAVQGHPRSLILAPIERAYATSC